MNAPSFRDMIFHHYVFQGPTGLPGDLGPPGDPGVSVSVTPSSSKAQHIPYSVPNLITNLSKVDEACQKQSETENNTVSSTVIFSLGFKAIFLKPVVLCKRRLCSIHG